MSNIDDQRELYRGRHLSLVARGGWEFAARNTARPAVGIVAVTEADEVILVEQFRPPVGRTVVELPAGLAGDISGSEDEPLLEAAKRELLEETGYVAERWTELTHGYSSPGLTDESLVLFLAEGLTKSGPGGGDGSENITIHAVRRSEVLAWLRERSAAADLKLLAGLHAAAAHLGNMPPIGF
jgi:ADP-ribose pyrophosphatase